MFIFKKGFYFRNLNGSKLKIYLFCKKTKKKKWKQEKERKKKQRRKNENRKKKEKKKKEKKSRRKGEAFGDLSVSQGKKETERTAKRRLNGPAH